MKIREIKEILPILKRLAEIYDQRSERHSFAGNFWHARFWGYKSENIKSWLNHFKTKGE